MCQSKVFFSLQGGLWGLLGLLPLEEAPLRQESTVSASAAVGLRAYGRIPGGLRVFEGTALKSWVWRRILLSPSLGISMWMLGSRQLMGVKILLGTNSSISAGRELSARIGVMNR